MNPQKNIYLFKNKTPNHYKKLQLIKIFLEEFYTPQLNLSKIYNNILISYLITKFY